MFFCFTDPVALPDLPGEGEGAADQGRQLDKPGTQQHLILSHDLQVVQDVLWLSPGLSLLGRVGLINARGQDKLEMWHYRYLKERKGMTAQSLYFQMFISFTADFSRALLSLLEGKVLYCRSLLVYLLFLMKIVKVPQRCSWQFSMKYFSHSFWISLDEMTTTSLSDFATHPLILRRKATEEAK